MLKKLRDVWGQSEVSKSRKVRDVVKRVLELGILWAHFYLRSYTHVLHMLTYTRMCTSVYMYFITYTL